MVFTLYSLWASSSIHLAPLASPFTPSSANQNKTHFTFLSCRSAKQQNGSVKKRTNTRDQEKKKRSAKPFAPLPPSIEEEEELGLGPTSLVGTHQACPLPKPPAGFLLDSDGRVVVASSKRIATIVDPANNLPLECIIRRVFTSAQGDECMLLCPVDTPIQILKSTNFDGWSAVPDDEVEGVIPAAAYALAKIHMHLVLSGFCYTTRGGFCYSEEDILEFGSDDGQSIDGLPAEGVEITCFHQDGVHFMIYTPSDPLLFVAVKDENGVLKIAEDELLEDPAVISAIDEETEFNALVEEEAALLESLLGGR